MNNYYQGRAIIIFFAVVVWVFTGFVVCDSMAGEELLLTEEKQVVPLADRINVQRYVIIPPPEGKIIVTFDWKSSTGEEICGATATLEGADFNDVMAFSIRSQDVGTAIGAGLKQLIWNKMKVIYGIDFQ